MAKEKRYFFTVTEEMIANKGYENFCAGRIEVRDNTKKSDHASYEARFMIPREFMDDFRKMWDGKASDEMPYIRWDYPKEKLLNN